MRGRAGAAPRNAVAAHLRRFDLDGSEIAVIGMAGRFPGAPEVDTFWRNVRHGVDSIRVLTEAELRELGAPEEAASDPAWVPAVASFDGYDLFDASFFGMSHREAEITDPQHRVALECAWHALEDAGYAPSRCHDPVGVFVGATINTYLLLHVAPNRALAGSLEPVQINLSNGSDFLATRIAYKLDLKGPAFTIQSACSTSLVAVHAACQSLHAEECDMALAGGVSVNVSHRFGYRHVAGGMASPDGRCRPFDAGAQGTVFGAGVGLVVVKRLEDALEDGDAVRAVIRGSAVNNDGSVKVGYTAPSVEGQAKVISEALADAAVDPETVGYVEAHGTATPLGDPIEVEALRQAFARSSRKEAFCALGSVKGNVGHLDAAAGVTGLIKTVLALEHREIPPSPHFHAPNPDLPLADGPFYVAAELAEWTAPPGRTRRAGVSAFGVGGTNAHVVLQEAPPPMERPQEVEAPQLLVLSAATPEALERSADRLATWLEEGPSVPLADLAFTLQAGRAELEHRLALVVSAAEDAARDLRRRERDAPPSSRVRTAGRAVAYLLPGQGAQGAGVTAGLYRRYEVFRRELDRCAEAARPQLGLDLRELLHREDARLHETRFTQPALFAVEYSLARLWSAWGVEPAALVGHSVGEFTAACLAGVLSPEDTLEVLALRGRLIQELPPGAMLSVPLGEEEIEPFMTSGLAVAARNGPGRLVVAGESAAVEALERRLAGDGVVARRLRTSHAFHSPMMAPAAGPLREALRRVELHLPKVPFLSTVTGTWIEPDQAVDPDHWARQLTSPVRFADALGELLRGPERLLLEVGPGTGLSQLARRHPERPTDRPVVASLAPAPGRSGDAALLDALGRLWLAGAAVDWSAVAAPGARRVGLPTYPFERRRYWIEPARVGGEAPSGTDRLARQAPGRSPREGWLYRPAWRAAVAVPAGAPVQLPASCLLLVGGGGVGEGLAERLQGAGVEVATVRPGSSWASDGAGGYTVAPDSSADWEALVRSLSEGGAPPEWIVHLWCLDGGRDAPAVTARRFEQEQDRGFLSVLHLLQAWKGEACRFAPAVTVVADRVAAVTDLEPLDPARAPLEALPLVLVQEGVAGSCRLVDVLLPDTGRPEPGWLAALLAEVAVRSGPQVVALRGRQRWWRAYEPLAAGGPDRHPASGLPEPGAFVVAGGLRGVGAVLARKLAARPGTRVAVLDEASEPELERLSAGLAEHGGKGLAVPVARDRPETVGPALARVRRVFGELTGIVHCWSAEEDAFAAATDVDPAHARAELGASVRFALALEEALAPAPPDVEVVSSPLSTVVGGVGTVVSVAASLFLERFVESRRRAAGRWLVLGWDAWRFGDDRPQVAAFSRELARAAIEPEDGAAVFAEALAGLGGRVLVSTVNLPARVREIEERRPRRGSGPGPVPAEEGRHPRPALDTPFVAPRTDLEQTVARIWQQALGLDSIGVDDNFFELGGDSLIAIQVVDRLQRELGREVNAVSLYEGLTVRSLTGLLEGGGPDGPQPDGPGERTERAERRHRFRTRRRRDRQERSPAGRGGAETR